MNFVAALVRITSTSAPACVSWEARSAALYAAIEPVTPSRMRLLWRREMGSMRCRSAMGLRGPLAVRRVELLVNRLQLLRDGSLPLRDVVADGLLRLRIGHDQIDGQRIHAFLLESAGDRSRDLDREVQGRELHAD